ncbi:putative general secretion pathway protein I [Escherichia coli]|nr:putative general secretion pathway protein I [Escherichia coli]CTR77521.1 putative general secretion pathway protein I [Escherichia coli]CTT57681.1 putative general secretion pathway protein I [Escherichia coli]CTU96261.1 putative general secretion pathway protein I [Escherichia coli]CTW01283.1 putative general secretion pathway protein I [Escherichia coli]
MNKQSGMTLLEVLLAMSIFTAVALTLMSSMQGQRNAIERMRNETLALWIADICEIIRSTVLFVLLWMAGRINPPRRCWNMSRAFFWKVTAGKARNFLSQSRYICRLSNMGGYSAVLHYLSS